MTPKHAALIAAHGTAEPYDPEGNAQADIEDQHMEKAMSEHTPTPWALDIGTYFSTNDPYLRSVTGPDGETVRVKGFALSSGKGTEANTALIVRAVNAHTLLVDALTEVNDWIKNWAPTFIYDDEWDETYAKIEAALALAKAES